MKNRHTDTNHHRRLYLPEHPAELQEPLRLYLSGKSFTEVADLIGCERRTAAKLIKLNLAITDIGRWDTSCRKLSGYEELIQDYIDKHSELHNSLLSHSKAVFSLLRKNGYTGSERTVRNHLSRQEWINNRYHNKDGGNYVKNYKHR